MRKSFLAAFAILLIPVIVPAQPAIPAMPDGAEPLFSKVMAAINTRHVTWVRSTAEQVNGKNLTDDQVRTEARQYAVLGNMGGADIEALCFLVLMQAAKSVQEDLKAIMAKVKAINEQKQILRAVLAAMNKIQLDSIKLLLKDHPAIGQKDTASLKLVTRTEIDDIKNKFKKHLDSMSEMGEMESLRLQMAMDRLSKMMSTLSNLLKKISRTSDAIIRNLK